MLTLGRKLTSFHLEMMTFGIKRGHVVGLWLAEVAIVLAYLPGWIRRPFPDPWASGAAPDAYLREDQREACGGAELRRWSGCSLVDVVQAAEHWP